MPSPLTAIAHRGDPSHDAAHAAYERTTRYPPHCDGGTGQYRDPASGEFVGACPGCLLCAPPADPDDPGLEAEDVHLTVGGG